jgi:hypothetical protein
MKKYPEVYKKQEHSFEDDYATLDIASTMDCTGMIPTPPLNEYEVDNYADIYTVPQQSAINAQNASTTSDQRNRSSVKGDEESVYPQNRQG